MKKHMLYKYICYTSICYIHIYIYYINMYVMIPEIDPAARQGARLSAELAKASMMSWPDGKAVPCRAICLRELWFQPL